MRVLTYEDARRNCVRHYECAALTYDRELFVRAFRRAELRAFRRVLASGRLLPDTPALDFGCGTGRQTLELAALGMNVRAYDAAESMRSVLGAQLAHLSIAERVEVVRSESEALARLHDLVVSIGVLDYYSDPAPLVARLTSALRPGGQLVLSFPDSSCPLAWGYSLGSRLVCPAHLHSRGEIVSIARQLGLRPYAWVRSPVDFAPFGMLTFVGFERRESVLG